MKNLNLKLATIALMVSGFANAQIDFTTPVQNFKTQLETIFVWVIGIAFLIYAMVQVFNMLKEGGDWKKSLGNILMFVVIAAVVVGLYAGVQALTL
jgi:hypothetical protein